MPTENPLGRREREGKREKEKKKRGHMGHASCTCTAHAYYPSPFAHREHRVLLAQERVRIVCICILRRRDFRKHRFVKPQNIREVYFLSTDHIHSPCADIMPFYNIHILLLGNFTTVNVSSGPLSGKVIKVCLTLTISIYFHPTHPFSLELHNLANKKNHILR